MSRQRNSLKAHIPLPANDNSDPTGGGSSEQPEPQDESLAKDNKNLKDKGKNWEGPTIVFDEGDDCCARDNCETYIGKPFCVKESEVG
jgi:hypothetical protein